MIFSPRIVFIQIILHSLIPFFRDSELGVSKGYGFISYDSFESSDLAIECMNGQFLCNRPIVVQYAFKKETPGERHGYNIKSLIHLIIYFYFVYWFICSISL